MINILNFYHEFAFSTIVYTGANIGLQDIYVMITQSTAYSSQNAFNIGTNYGQPYWMDLFR